MFIIKENENQSLLSSVEFQKIFKALPTPSYLWRKIDEDLILIDYNDVADEIVKGNMKNFLGISASELYKDNPQILNDLKKCVNGEIIPPREILYKYISLELEKYLSVSYRSIPPDLILVHTDDITKQKEFERFLKKSESEKSIIFENLKEHVVFQDINHRLIWCNKAACESVNSSLEQLIGRTCFEIWQNQDVVCEKCPVDIALKTGRQERGEAITPDGRVWDIRGNPVRDNEGNIVGAVELTTEITEQIHIQQKLKESEEKFRTMADQSLIGIIIVQDGKVVYVNQAESNIMEYSTQEMMEWTKKDLFKHIHPDDRSEATIRIRKSQEEIDIPPIFSYRIRTKSGKTKIVEIYTKVIDLNEKPALLTYVLDVSDKKKAEQKLKESEEKYREAYNRSDLYKDLFTHDINNILQNILTSVDLSKLYSSNMESKEELKEIWNLISEQIIRGKKLVLNVQKLSEVEEVETPIESTEVLNILNKAIEFVKESFPYKVINIEKESLKSQYLVNANELLINIFENILFNGIKHNTHNIIDIKIKISKERKYQTNYIKFEFLDNGVGIHDSMKSEIFSRNFHDYKKDTKSSGIGLGLLLINRILNSYNGEIRVEDRVEGDYSKGSNFIILIPEAI